MIFYFFISYLQNFFKSVFDFERMVTYQKLRDGAALRSVVSVRLIASHSHWQLPLAKRKATAVLAPAPSPSLNSS